jgi:hypothetical protein
MAKSFIWISFDLGIQGDYEGMYSWLDSHEAQECGDSVAALEFEYQEDLLKELKRELESSVKIDKKARVYVIRRVDGKVKGRFLFGQEKRSLGWIWAEERGKRKRCCLAAEGLPCWIRAFCTRCSIPGTHGTLRLQRKAI